MKLKNIFGIILLIIGVYLLYGIYKSSLPILYGTKVKANIIGVDSVKSKRFTYVYYPVLQFNHHNQSIKFTDKSNSVDKDIAKPEIMVYYDPNYGLSNGFTVVTATFLIMGLLMVMLGILALFTLFKIDNNK